MCSFICDCTYYYYYYVIKQLGTDFQPIYILDSFSKERLQEHQTISRQANQGVHRIPAITE